MRYQIVFEKPGRMRVRFGEYAFDKSLENRIQMLAIANIFILSAEARSANGGLLIIYQKEHRSDVISFVESLNFRSLSPLDEDSTTKEIDGNFKKGLVKLGVNHLVRKLLVPAPLRPFLLRTELQSIF